MAEETRAILLWDRELETILYEVGELSDRRQFAAYFSLLFRILFEEELHDRERRLAAGAVLSQLDCHVSRDTSECHWGSIAPEPLMFMVMIEMRKLGLDIDPLKSKGWPSFFPSQIPAQVDLKDGATAAAVVDLFSDLKENPEADLYRLLELVVAFSKGGNEPIARRMLGMFRNSLSSLGSEFKRIDHWCLLVKKLLENGCERLGTMILEEHLPVIEDSAFSISLRLLELSKVLKKTDRALAGRLFRRAVEEIQDVAAIDIGKEEFEREFGKSKTGFLSEAAVALAGAGKLKLALEYSERSRRSLFFKANGLIEIAMILIGRGRTKSAGALLAGARESLDACRGREDTDTTYQSLSDALTRMGREEAALEALDPIRETWIKCHALDRIALAFFDMGEWKKGEEYIESAIRMSEEVENPKMRSYCLEDAAICLVAHGYDDRALSIIGSAGDVESWEIRLFVYRVFDRVGAPKAMEFLEKAYDLPFPQRDGPLAGFMGKVH